MLQKQRLKSLQVLGDSNISLELYFRTELRKSLIWKIVFTCCPITHCGKLNNIKLDFHLICSALLFKNQNKPPPQQTPETGELNAARTPNQCLSLDMTWTAFQAAGVLPCLLALTRHVFCILLFNWDSQEASKKVSAKCSGPIKQPELSPPTNYPALPQQNRNSWITFLAAAL